MKIEPARIEDAKKILALQKLAYIQEAELINDFSIPPLHQTLEDFEGQFSSNIILKIEREGKIIGSVRAIQTESTCYIGRLIVHPDLQRNGYGSALIQKIESKFTSCQRYELFTGKTSLGNIRLYKRHGYKPFKEEGILVFMEKSNL